MLNRGWVNSLRSAWRIWSSGDGGKFGTGIMVTKLKGKSGGFTVLMEVAGDGKVTELCGSGFQGGTGSCIRRINNPQFSWMRIN